MIRDSVFARRKLRKAEPQHFVDQGSSKKRRIKRECVPDLHVRKQRFWRMSIIATSSNMFAQINKEICRSFFWIDLRKNTRRVPRVFTNVDDTTFAYSMDWIQQNHMERELVNKIPRP